MPIFARRAVLLAKVESTPGTDATPTAGSNAILIENPRWVNTPNLITTNEVNGSLDADEPVVGGIKGVLSFDVYMKGSGTPETPPEWGVLLRASRMAETITATAVPSSPEACAAGGSTTTAVLGASAVNTANLYDGMPIVFTGTVAQSDFIADYVTGKTATLAAQVASAAIVATTSYQILKNVVYRPASSSIPSLTFWLYKDGKLYKGVGARGTWTFSLTTAGTGKFSFTFQVVWTSITDAALVTGTYQLNVPKPIMIGGRVRWNRIACKVRSLTLDCGNTVVFPDNPEASQGYDPAEITAGMMKGTMDPQESLISARDIFADMAAGTKRIVHAQFGSVAGNRFGITIPQGMATANDQSQERDGMAVEGVEFQCVGADQGLFICHY